MSLLSVHGEPVWVHVPPGSVQIQVWRGGRSTRHSLAALLPAHSGSVTVRAAALHERTAVLGLSAGALVFALDALPVPLPPPPRPATAAAAAADVLALGTDDGVVLYARHGTGWTARTVAAGLGPCTALALEGGRVHAAVKGGARLVTLDAASGAALGKGLSVATPPVQVLLAVPGAGVMFASADRKVVWRRSETDSVLLMGKSRALAIDVAPGQRSAAVLEEGGEVALYALTAAAGSLRPAGRVRAPTALLAAQWSDPHTLVLVHGSPLRPAIASVRVTGADGALLAAVTVEAAAPVLTAAGAAPRERDVPEQLLSVADLRVPTVSEASAPATVPDGVELLPFAERVRTTGAPRVESLERALVQALRTDDRELLVRVLEGANAAAVRATVERLPLAAVLPLLRAVAARLQAHPGAAPALALWVQDVLLTHLAYLVTVPALAETLAPLHALVEGRTAAFLDLLRLQGRVQLLVTHMGRARRAARTTLHSAPQHTYAHDSDSDPSDMEVADSESGESSDSASASLQEPSDSSEDDSVSADGSDDESENESNNEVGISDDESE